jgi:hypothetical protein
VAAVDSSLITAMSVREHFSSALETATRNQEVALGGTTSAYVVNLLTEYCDARALAEVSDGGRHIRPLALLYAEALDAEHPEQRRRALQKLGDIALFIAGIFTDSLARRAVDVDYYIGMGESAYGYLHESLQRSSRAAGFADLFAELERKFGALVDVLGEISEMSGLKSNTDTLRAYELWLKTGSVRAHRQLLRNGIHPIGGAVMRQAH